jgi:hypothetical protein
MTYWCPVFQAQGMKLAKFGACDIQVKSGMEQTKLEEISQGIAQKGAHGLLTVRDA